MNPDKKRALGRGLETLIPAARATAAPAPAAAGESVRQIPVEEIERNPYQTRSRVEEAALEEMAASSRASGVLQPIVVRYISREPQPGAAVPHGSIHASAAAQSGATVPHKQYQLIAGERRWLASQRAGKATVPAIVRQVSNEQAMEMTIIENLQREDLNPMDQAAAFERLAREFGLTQEQIAQKTGKDRTSISNFLRLLRLPPEVQALVQGGDLSFGHAKALMALDSPQAIVSLAQQVVKDGLSVRQTVEVIEELLRPAEPKAEKPARVVDPNVREAERELERALGVRVQIKDRKGKGKIVIEYHSLEDFDRVVEALKK